MGGAKCIVELERSDVRESLVAKGGVDKSIKERLLLIIVFVSVDFASFARTTWPASFREGSRIFFLFFGASLGSTPFRDSFAHFLAFLRALFSETSGCGPIARVVSEVVCRLLPCPTIVSDWDEALCCSAVLTGSMTNLRPWPPLPSP